jgi:TolB-like protein
MPHHSLSYNFADKFTGGHTVLRIGDLQVDPALDEIRKGGRTIKLEPKSMQLLMCLASSAGKVISVGELLDQVWKDVVVSQDSVYAAVAALRRILGDNPKKPSYIANVARRGYRLVAPVSPWVVTPAEPIPNAIAPAAAADKPSIVVMPFLNLSGDPTQEYFSDGITEDIITELSRWRSLAVRSRSASFRNRDLTIDVKQVARQLAARFVVEGSVRRMGDRIRISVQLIDAESGHHVWSEKFDRKLDQIFVVIDRVVQTIVSTLVGRVQVSVNEQSRRKPPTSLAAYECVLKGNALPWDEPSGAAEATRLVEQAIELDPGYALAHTLLAALTYSRWDDGPRSSDAAMEKAHALLMRAIELDDSESTAHALLANIFVQRRDFNLAVRYSRRAIEINPNNQWNVADLGSILTYVGECDEALACFSRAREIDPYFDEPWYWRAAGLANMTLDRYADAVDSLSHARVRAFPFAALVAGCHARLGDMPRTRSSVAECLAIKPDFSVAEFVGRQPFKNQADAERLAATLRLAGLPP